MFDMKQRTGLVVWVVTLKTLKTLRRYGTIMYVSRRLKYVYLYLDRDEIADTRLQLIKLRFVKRVEPTHRPELKTEFGDEIGQLQPTEEDLETQAKPTRHARLLTGEDKGDTHARL